jgi:transcriptional regulator with XRE-family HTH domain
MTENELKYLFGRNIRNFRTAKGWSQEHLAEKADVSLNTINEIENGKKFVRLNTLILFSEIFDVDVYKFFIPENAADYGSLEMVEKFTEGVKEVVLNFTKNYIDNM